MTGVFTPQLLNVLGGAVLIAFGCLGVFISIMSTRADANNTPLTAMTIPLSIVIMASGIALAFNIGSVCHA